MTDNTEKKPCTCPSGDGSLRWPCQEHGAPVVVPDGWKLVPMEPTREMWATAGDCVTTLQRAGIEHHDKISSAVYRAMLAAAPAAPAPAAQEPVAWQFYQDGRWWNGDDRILDHRKNTEEAGFPTRDLFTAPPAAEQPDAVKIQLAVLKAQTHKPSDFVTGTSNWAAYMTAQIVASALLGKESEDHE